MGKLSPGAIKRSGTITARCTSIGVAMPEKLFDLVFGGGGDEEGGGLTMRQTRQSHIINLVEAACSE